MFGETIKQDSIMEKGYEFYLKYVIEKIQLLAIALSISKWYFQYVSSIRQKLMFSLLLEDSKT